MPTHLDLKPLWDRLHSEKNITSQFHFTLGFSHRISTVFICSFGAWPASETPWVKHIRCGKPGKCTDTLKRATQRRWLRVQCKILFPKHCCKIMYIHCSPGQCKKGLILDRLCVTVTDIFFKKKKKKHRKLSGEMLAYQSIFIHFLYPLGVQGTHWVK